MIPKRNISILIKWAIGLCILWILIEKVDIDRILLAFSEVDFLWLFAGFLVIVLTRIFQAWQMKIVVRHQDIGLTTPRAFAINLVTGFYSLILPGDVGAGVMRWHKLSKPSGKRVEVLAALLFLRLINSTVILLFGIIALMIENPFDSQVLTITAIALFGVIVFGYFCASSERIFMGTEKHIREFFSRISPSIGERLNDLWSALAQYRALSRGNLVKIASVSLLNLLSSVTLFYLLAKTLRFSIPVLTLVWVRAMVLIIHLIPVSIAGLGIREGSLVYIFPMYGISPAEAIAFSLLLFALMTLLGLVGGVIEAYEVLISPVGKPLREDGPGNNVDGRGSSGES